MKARLRERSALNLFAPSTVIQKWLPRLGGGWRSGGRRGSQKPQSRHDIDQLGPEAPAVCAIKAVPTAVSLISGLTVCGDRRLDLD
jgi:hypothetical protein